MDRLARDGKSIPAGDLAEALGILCSLGAMREVYRVMDYDNSLLEGEYETRDTIPPRLPDRLHQRYIDTSETDIVPAYRLEHLVNGQ